MPPPGLSSEDIDAPTRWFRFQAAASAIKFPKGAKLLPCMNVWLFPAESAEQALRHLANSADEHKLSHASYLIEGNVTAL